MAIQQFYAPAVVSTRTFRGKTVEHRTVADAAVPLVAASYDADGDRMVVTVHAGTQVPSDWTPCLPPEEEDGVVAVEPVVVEDASVVEAPVEVAP